MRHLFSFTLSFCFLFCINVLSVDLINSTCQQCADRSTTLNYEFCLTSFQQIPISHVTNLQGLALISMELALENATSTISSIEKMIYSQQFDPFALVCLKDCLELYGDAVPMLANVIVAFLSEQYDVADLLMSAVMETTSTCEEGFEEKKGEVSPLTEDNYNLFQLGGVALCIINLLSVALET